MVLDQILSDSVSLCSGCLLDLRGPWILDFMLSQVCSNHGLGHLNKLVWFESVVFDQLIDVLLSNLRLPYCLLPLCRPWPLIQP
jgi:hypothetical protein